MLANRSPDSATDWPVTLAIGEGLISWGGVVVAFATAATSYVIEDGHNVVKRW